ncbi:MAG: hypothetical protein ACO3A4_10920 [Silvanigrellaceae bacterium]
MNLTIDLEKKYFHIGTRPLRAIEDFIIQGFYPFIQEQGFEELQKRILSVSIPAKFIGGTYWFRLTLLPFLRFEYSALPAANGRHFESQLMALNLATLQPYIASTKSEKNHSRISTDGNLIRIDDNGGQRIFRSFESFYFDSVHSMLIRPHRFLTLGPKHFGVWIIVLIPFALALLTGLKFWGNSFKSLNSNFPPEASQNAVSERQNTEYKSQNPDQKPLSSRDGKNFGEMKSSDSGFLQNTIQTPVPVKPQITQGTDIDPMRCGPISEYNQGRRKSSKSGSSAEREEWIVCR